MDGVLFFALGWGLFSLVLFFLAPRFVTYVSDRLTAKQCLVFVAAVALLIRLIPNFVLSVGGGYDIESYQIVGDVLLSGEDVYTHPDSMDRHPYLPFQMYWMAGARWLSNIAHIPFVKVVRLASIGADVIIALVLFSHLEKKTSLAAGLRAGLLYALNPITMFVSAYHGQFDAFPALFLLLSVIAAEKSSVVSGVWLGMGILSKSWPVLGLPSLWIVLDGWRKRLWFLFGMVGIPLLGICVYLVLTRAQVWLLLSRTLGYNWGIGVWGYTYFFRLLAFLNPHFVRVFDWIMRYSRLFTLSILGLVWFLKARKQPVSEGVLTVLVTYFAATHAFSIQYLMWLVPFALLNQEVVWFRRYLLGASAYMLLVYTTLILGSSIMRWLPWPQGDVFVIIPSSLFAWLVTVGWARDRWKIKA